MTAISHETDSAETLDAARHTLIRQLIDHPDDVGATVELQAVNAASSRLADEAVDDTARDSLRRSGMSSNDRTRLRLHHIFGRGR
jgi:hypothetical protein